VSPALDLAESAAALHLPANRLYERYFLWNLKRSIRRKARLFEGQYDVTRLRGLRSLRDFDDRITAFYCGFTGAEHYYAQSSASPFLGRIAIPTLVIHSLDDPFIRITPASHAGLLANPCIRYLQTERGGHCGFLAAARDGDDGRWAERTVVEFLRRV
jgi:uncharacterized protein